MNAVRKGGGFLALVTAGMIVVLVGRVFDLFTFLHGVPAVKVLTALALLAFVLAPRRERLPFGLSRIARLFIWLVALAALSVAFSLWRGGSFGMLTGPIAALVVLFGLIYKTCGDEADLERVLRALGWCAGILTVTGFLVNTGDRLSFGGVYDPNDLAFVLIAILPIVLAFWRMTRAAKALFWLTLAAGSVAVIMFTQSRGGLLGLLAAAAYLAAIGAWRARLQPKLRFGQTIAGAVLLAALAIPTWFVLPADTQDRFASILNPTEDYNFTAQREGRIPLWERGMETLAERPWGVGVGAYASAEMSKSGYWRTAHNSQVQIAVELGVLGWLLYAALFVRSWRVLTRIASGVGTEGETPIPDAWRIIAQHLKASLLGILFAGFFLSMAYSNVVYAIFAVIAVLEARYCPRPLTRRAVLLGPAPASVTPAPSPPPIAAGSVPAGAGVDPGHGARR